MRGSKPFLVLLRNTATTNITGTYSELEDSVVENCSKLVLLSTASMQVIIGLGASGSEDDLVAIATTTIFPTIVDVMIPKGARLAVKSLTGGTISSGTIGVTFLN